LVAHQRAAEGIHFALRQEERTHESGNAAYFGALIDSNVAGRWHSSWRAAWENGLQDQEHFGVTLVAVAAHAELAVATVLVTDPAPDWGNVSVYREQRYYRQRGQHWVRTVPTATFWGEIRAIETPHFRIEYYAPDAAAAVAVGAQIEAINTQLYRQLAITSPQQQEQQIFALVPELIRNWNALGNRVELMSPALAQIPAPLTDEGYLLQLVARRLSYQAIEAATARTRNGAAYRWNLLRWGVQSWLVAEVTATRAPWSVEAEDALREILLTKPVVTLALVNRWYNTDNLDPTEVMARYALAETVATYAFRTYGTDRLPILLQNLSVHSTWKELVPRTFGVPLAEFEAGWQNYVLATYGPGAKESQ
jgi:hypothetical protein